MKPSRGQVPFTSTIDTADHWKWITVTKTFAYVGGSPRLFYDWDAGGVSFQVYGAQVADITDPLYVLPIFL